MRRATLQRFIDDPAFIGDVAQFDRTRLGDYWLGQHRDFRLWMAVSQASRLELCKEQYSTPP